MKANLGVSIFSKRQISTYLNQDNQRQITTIKLGEQGLKVYWHVVYLNQPQVAQAAASFVELLKNEVS